MNMQQILCVALGGAVGSVGRYLAVQLVMRFQPQPFPLGTMLVNIIGSFAIGVLMARFSAADSESSRLFLVTGVLGGFTTFSAFSWDALVLMQRGNAGQMALYIAASVGLSFVAVAMGFALAK
jgi:CrcB protein